MLQANLPRPIARVSDFLFHLWAKNSFFASVFTVGISQFSLIWWLRNSDNRDIGASIWMIALQSSLTIAVFYFSYKVRWLYEARKAVETIAETVGVSVSELTKPRTSRRNQNKAKRSRERPPRKLNSAQLVPLVTEGSTVRNFLLISNLLLASVAIVVEFTFFLRWRRIEFDTYSALVTVPLTFLIAGSVPYYLELFKKISATEKDVQDELKALRNDISEYDRHSEPIWQFYKSTIANDWAKEFQSMLYQLELDSQLSNSSKKNSVPNFRETLMKEIDIYRRSVLNRSQAISEQLENAQSLSLNTQPNEIAYIQAAHYSLITAMERKAATNDRDEFDEVRGDFFKRIGGFPEIRDDRLTAHRLNTWLDNHSLCRVEATDDKNIYPKQAASRILLASDFRDTTTAITQSREQTQEILSDAFFYLLSEINKQTCQGCRNTLKILMIMASEFATQDYNYSQLKDAIQHNIHNIQSSFENSEIREKANVWAEKCADRKWLRNISLFLRGLQKITKDLAIETSCETKQVHEKGSTGALSPAWAYDIFFTFIEQQLNESRHFIDGYERPGVGSVHPWLFPTDERVHYLVINRMRSWKSGERQQQIHGLLDHQTLRNRCIAGTKRHLDNIPTYVKRIEESCNQLGLNYHALTEDHELFTDLLDRYRSSADARSDLVDRFVEGVTAAFDNAKTGTKTVETADWDNDALLARNLVYALALHFLLNPESSQVPSRLSALHHYIKWNDAVRSASLHPSPNGRPTGTKKSTADGHQNAIPNGNAAKDIREFWIQLRNLLREQALHHRRSSSFVVNSSDLSLEFSILELTHHRGPMQNWIRAANAVNRRHVFRNTSSRIIESIRTARHRNVLGLPVLPSRQLIAEIFNQLCEIPQDNYTLDLPRDITAAPVRLAVVSLTDIELWNIEDLMKALQK